MNRQFVLHVEYGTGSANMLTNKITLIEAIQEFLDEYSKGIPDCKCYGLPEVRKAELVPLMHKSIYEAK